MKALRILEVVLEHLAQRLKVSSTQLSSPPNAGWRCRCLAISIGRWLCHLGIEWSQRWRYEVPLPAVSQLRQVDVSAVQLQPAAIASRL